MSINEHIFFVWQCLYQMIIHKNLQILYDYTNKDNAIVYYRSLNLMCLAKFNICETNFAIMSPTDIHVIVFQTRQYLTIK